MDDVAALALLIPIVGTIMGVGLAMLAVVLYYRQRTQKTELRHRERLAALEKGIELPPDPEPEPRRPRYLLRGLVWLFTGIAIFVFLGAVADDDVALLGGIPAAVGLAYLIFYFVEGRHEKPAPGAVETGR